MSNELANPPRHWNTGLLFRRVILTSWRKSVFLAVVDQPSSDGITIKKPYGVDVLLHQPASHPSFPIRLVEAESGFIVRLVETDIGGQALVVAVISVNVSPFLAFSDQTRHLEDTWIGVFWLHCAASHWGDRT